MIAIDTEKFIAKARELIKQDTRNPLERSARKRPKIDFLNSISEVIIGLFDNLFTVSDQVYLINTVDKKFSVSDTTYLKFLNENLKEEYDLYRKNRVFALKIYKIKEALSLYPASAKIQFSAIFGSDESVSFEDYLFFIKNYYSKSEKVFFETRAVKKYSTTKRELVFDGEALRPTDIVTPRETFADITPRLRKSAATSEDGAKSVKKNQVVKTANKVSPVSKAAEPHPNGTVSSRNTKKRTGFKIYNSYAERDVLRNEKGHFRMSLVSGADLNQPQELFKVLNNRDEFPEEIMNTKFLLANYSSSSFLMEEPYVFLRDIDLIHYSDPDTYGLVDGLLYICDTMYGKAKGYDLYRYYNGNIYFIENLNFAVSGNVTFLRDVDDWTRYNVDGELSEFSQDFLTMKNERMMK